MNTFTAITVLVLLFLPQQPPRDVSKVPAGTGVIEGTVVDEISGRPLRRVSLELVPGVAQFFTTTDTEGHFKFTGLVAGRYFLLRASRPGFVGTNYRSGAPIVLAEGQHMTVALTMVPGAVISGTVFDQGRPVAQTTVTATPVRTINGQRVLGQGFWEAQTDQRGEYRLVGLRSGDYLVSAAPQMQDGIELRTVTADEIKWAQQIISSSAQTGGTPPNRTAAPPPPSRPITYAPIYYPGATDISQAATVTLAPAQERGGVDFTLQRVSTARIEGTVLDADGRPAQRVEVTISPRGSPGVTIPQIQSDMLRMLRPTVTNGTFSAATVPPGSYTISARGGFRSDPNSMTDWARMEVSVNGVDQSGLQLRLQPGMTISGTVAFEDITQPPPTTRPRATVSIYPEQDPGVGRFPGVFATTQVAPDGTFTILGVPPGRYFLRPGSPVSRPPQWHVKSARVGDIEAADRPFEVRASENISNVRIVFTNRTGEITGRLLDPSGQPAPDYWIILFPTDKAMWNGQSRRFPRSSRTDITGKYGFLDLLAGDWYVAAVSNFDGQDIYNAEFLSQLAATAVKVTLAEQEKKTQDLQISKVVGQR